MALIYTTIDAISRRLRGRLQIQEMQPLTLGGQTVDPELIEQYAEQVQDYMNLYLGNVYEMPLQLSHHILADIAECLIIGKIMETHFQGSPVAAQATDAGGMAMDLSRQGERKLQLLMPQELRSDPTIPPQTEPLILQGELLKPRRRDSITANTTVVADRNLEGPARKIYWGGMENLSPRARGAEPFWSGRRRDG